MPTVTTEKYAKITGTSKATRYAVICRSIFQMISPKQLCDIDLDGHRYNLPPQRESIDFYC